MGPDLDNKKLFDCRPGVPILDIHTRRNGQLVDRDKLNLIAQNSNARAERGDPGLMFIGHTKVEPDAKETDQPPLAGYMRNYRLGEYQGRPCILADLLYDKSKPQAFEYPRRSVEVFYSNDPAQNYIDALALIKRAPERDLGLVAYAAKGRTKEFYAMADPNPSQQSLTESDIPALTAFMERKGLRDTGEGIRAYLQAKADGTTEAKADEFTQEDIPKLAQYMKVNDLPHSQYGEALARYQKEKREGKL